VTNLTQAQMGIERLTDAKMEMLEARREGGRRPLRFEPGRPEAAAAAAGRAHSTIVMTA
jgi:hypothetical protein